MNSKNRHERQERFFGQEGQEKINKMHVVIVGVGGVGSHVAQQLAHLGVGKLTIVDEDKLEETNLNRLIGVYDQDPIGTSKVHIIYRMIKIINPDIKIDVIEGSIVSDIGLSVLRKADFVFGCVDDDGVRSFINEVAQAFEIPYMDIATEIHPEDMDYGGRIIFINGQGCLYCYNDIDQEEVNRYFESPEARKDREKIYGLDKDELGDSGPSVVTLNGVLASLACTEFLVFATNLRQPKKYLKYNGKIGIVTINTDEPAKECFYCESIRGSKETSYNFS